MNSLSSPLAFSRFIQSKPSGSFDSVPFLDVLLIALFFGLNSSVFVAAPGLAIELPASEVHASRLAGPAAVLTVAPNELYFFQGLKINASGLRHYFAEYLAGLPAEFRPGSVLLVKADSSIPSALLFAVMDEARLAGFGQILLAAEPTGNPITRSSGAGSSAPDPSP